MSTNYSNGCPAIAKSHWIAQIPDWLLVPFIHLEEENCLLRGDLIRIICDNEVIFCETGEARQSILKCVCSDISMGREGTACPENACCDNISFNITEMPSSRPRRHLSQSHLGSGLGTHTLSCVGILGGNSIGFSSPKNSPNIGPKTDPKCHWKMNIIFQFLTFLTTFQDIFSCGAKRMQL